MWSKSLWVCLGQLTAWINFCGLAVLFLALECARFAWATWTGGEPVGLQLPVVYLSLATIATHLGSKIWVLAAATSFDWGKTIRSYTTHLAYLEEGAVAWWDALLGIEKPFVRTNKFASNSHWMDLPLGFPLLLMGCTGVLVYAEYWVLSCLLGSMVVLLGNALWSLFRQVAATRALEENRAITEEVLAPITPKREIVLLATEEHNL